MLLFTALRSNFLHLVGILEGLSPTKALGPSFTCISNAYTAFLAVEWHWLFYHYIRLPYLDCYFAFAPSGEARSCVCSSLCKVINSGLMCSHCIYYANVSDHGWVGLCMSQSTVNRRRLASRFSWCARVFPSGSKYMARLVDLFA